MSMQKEIAEGVQEIATWRQDIHKHPELGFEEKRTSDIVAEKLQSFGVEIHRGLGKTGVVGILRVGSSSKSIGLRADMDALPIQEANNFAHCSVHSNIMHACGHDGHTAMLLGAARYLANSRNFDGTVYFIFQPAEEGMGGGKAMVDDGLFEQFSIDHIYGMHNWPGMPVGQFGVRTGPMIASMDTFDIVIKGTGGHAAYPQNNNDPIVIAGQLIGLLQTIVSRNVIPTEGAVLSITRLDAGSAYNIIPEKVTLRGCVRALDPEVQKLIKRRMRETVDGLCAAFGAQGEINYSEITPVLVNTQAETAQAVSVACTIAGESNVEPNYPPLLGSEDFAFMLQKRPGCYILTGNGGSEQEGGACILHNAEYDFNDNAIEWGATYWCQLVETVLAT